MYHKLEGMIKVYENFSKQRLIEAGLLTFESTDLNRRVTIADWLLIILETIMFEQEGFSGKRPFGNSSWEGEAEVALIKAGFLEGVVDEDGYIKSVEDSRYLFLAIIDACFR